MTFLKKCYFYDRGRGGEEGVFFYFKFLFFISFGHYFSFIFSSHFLFFDWTAFLLKKWILPRTSYLKYKKVFSTFKNSDNSFIKICTFLKFGIWLTHGIFNIYFLRLITYVVEKMKYFPKRLKMLKNYVFDLQLDLWTWLRTYIICNNEAFIDSYNPFQKVFKSFGK